MHIYLVGGAVRDTLLGLPVQDRDWVVVGATAQHLGELGFIAVGKDFPVFLHPGSREQYALARTERKTAPGYRGFVMHTAPDVTLEQDLERRDLTINAIAVDARYVQGDGNFDPAQVELTDPFHGQRDLSHKVLRHVSDAFHEDPVRILRVARFAARFADFHVASETMEFMRFMVAHGEASTLVAERVWQELARGLMEQQPSRMFEMLRACGALAIVLPEVDVLWQRPASGPDSDSGAAHLMHTLDKSARMHTPLAVRFACLCLRVGSASTARRAIDGLCQRLRAPTECRELAEVVAREHASIEACAVLDAAALVRLLERCDAFRKPGRFAEILRACECDARAEPAMQAVPYPQRQHLLAALAAARAVVTEVVATEAQAAGISGKPVGDMIHAARVAAVAAMGLGT